MDQMDTDKGLANLNPFQWKRLGAQPQESVSIGVHLWFWAF
jgi:hypothetical protein